MKFFPSENISYKTKLSAEEVTKRLSKNIEPNSNDWGRIFAGSIRGNEFEIRRNINYNNSFLPQITGTITAVNNETFVSVKLELIGFVKSFMMIFFLVMILIIVLIIYSIIESHHFSPFIFVPLIFSCIVRIMWILGFQAESSKCQMELKKIIEGEKTT